MSSKTKKQRSAAASDPETNGTAPDEFEEFGDDDTPQAPDLPSGLQVALDIPPMPEAKLPTGYQVRAPLNVQVSFRSSDKLRHVPARLFQRLNAGDARLASGRHVSSQADAIRWVLERMEAAGV